MFGEWGYALADRSNLTERLVDVYRSQIETTRHSDEI